MLLKDKYTPKTFNEFKIHLDIINKLKLLTKNEVPNIILHGAEGTGKYTLALNILSEIYGSDIYNKNYTKINIKINNNNKELKLVYSNYHYEIGVNKYLYNDKLSILKLIEHISNNRNVMTNSYNIIIIRNADHLSLESIKSLRRRIESLYTNFRLIITCHNSSKLRNIFGGQFLYINVPIPDNNSLFNFIKYISIEEKITINNSNINELIKQTTNLNKLLLILEYSTITGKYIKYIDTIKKEIKDLVKLIFSNNIHMISKIKQNIYALTSKNINITYIFKEIYNNINKSKLSSDCKLEILKLCSIYNAKICNSYKEVIHLEALVLNIMFTVSKYLS